MKIFCLLFFFLFFLVKGSISQNVDWFKSIDLNGYKFEHFSTHLVEEDIVLVGLKARDTSGGPDYRNEIYVSLIDKNSNNIYRFYFTPLDSSVNSEIKIYQTYLLDSILIIFGDCYLNSVQNFVYFYSTLNLHSLEVNSFNLGQKSNVNINSSLLEGDILVLLRSFGLSQYALDKINVLTNVKTETNFSTALGVSKYMNDFLYHSYDSVSINNDVFIVIHKLDTNGVLLKSNVINNNLKLLSNGIVISGFVRDIDGFFIEGSYDYNIPNATIPGNERDYFLIKIDPISLEQIQFFSLNRQFNNSTKSNAGVKFTYNDKCTLLINKIIEDNNQRMIRSFLMDDNGVIWNKPLTGLSTLSDLPIFTEVNIVENNFLQIMGMKDGSSSFINTTSENVNVDSFVVSLNPSSFFVGMIQVNAVPNSNSLYITGSYKNNINNEEELFVSKVNYLKTSVNDIMTGQLKVFPNPSFNSFNVKVDESVSKIELISIHGITLKEIQNSNEITLMDVPNGIYFLKVHTEIGKVYLNKVIVNK